MCYMNMEKIFKNTHEGLKIKLNMFKSCRVFGKEVSTLSRCQFINLTTSEWEILKEFLEAVLLSQKKSKIYLKKLRR